MQAFKFRVRASEGLRSQVIVDISLAMVYGVAGDVSGPLPCFIILHILLN